jgi:hypothetical protein
MYVFAILKTKSKKVFKLDEHIDLHEHFKLSEEPVSSEIIYEED